MLSTSLMSCCSSIKINFFPKPISTDFFFGSLWKMWNECSISPLDSVKHPQHFNPSTYEIFDDFESFSAVKNL